jgi:hypothetical protein
LALVALLMMSDSPAYGQLGGLGNRVRRAVQEAAAEKPAPKPAPTPAPTPAPSPAPAPAASAPADASSAGPYNDFVLVMTPEVLDRLAVALAAEVAEREEVARIAAAVRTPEAYEQCTMQVAMSAEGQRLTSEMSARGAAYMKDTADATAAAAYRQAQAAVIDHTRDQCGPDPDTFKATELPKLQVRPADAGQKAGGFTMDQYAILKERIAPLCGVAQVGANGEVRIPGEGEDIFWVYSPAEVAVLLPRCQQLGALVQAAA